MPSDGSIYSVEEPGAEEGPKLFVACYSELVRRRCNRYILNYLANASFASTDPVLSFRASMSLRTVSDTRRVCKSQRTHQN